MNQLQPVKSKTQQARDLVTELREAQEALRRAEADLAEEQAAVNAFRMHARLMLDDLADAIGALRAEKQSLLTRLELMRQDAELLLRDEDNPLGPEAEPITPSDDEDAYKSLPTPSATPRDKAA
jgi:hypothetical protein